jgi:hypothetical protein
VPVARVIAGVVIVPKLSGEGVFWQPNSVASAAVAPRDESKSIARRDAGERKTRNERALIHVMVRSVRSRSFNTGSL